MKNIIKKIINQFTLDKRLHMFVSGWLLFALVIALNGNLPLAVGTAISIGIVKEFYDYFIKGTGFNLIDIIYNFFGIFVSVVIYILFNN